MHFVGYLYIMDLITTCISVKQTSLQVSSAYVNALVMRLCVCVCVCVSNRMQVQLKISMNVGCFPQYAG
jgi:hypothetical protein